MPDVAIDINDLTKHFGRVRALDGLTMQVDVGDVHGFLGPNGAGKTTTLRILLGLLTPTSGTATVLGANPCAQAPWIHRRLAYIPGEVSLWPNLTGGEAIDVLARLRGKSDPKIRAELLERFQLDPKKKCRTYSRGNRQKVALVAAFCAPTELLLLDEPTAGLDPLMEREFTQLVKERADQGTTVLLSSHILSEVETLCSTVSIIKNGSLVETGTIASMRHLHRSHVSAPGDAALASSLSKIPGVHDFQFEGGICNAQVDNDALPTVMRVLSDEGAQNVQITAPTLEELFLSHYAEKGGAVLGVDAGAPSPRTRRSHRHGSS